MLSAKFFTRFIPLVTLTALLSAGCAAPYNLAITYQLPEPDQNMGQQVVSLNIVDQRPNGELAGPNAKKDLEHFTGLFSLSVERDDKKPALVGAFDLATLFKKALKQRLEAQGITVLGKMTPDKPAIEIRIETFVLDRDGKNWTATLAYTAATSLDKRILTNQTVAGSAERLKIVGVRDAEKLLGEIFSDMVNQLDPAKLLDHPDL